jgi:tetratricopeptide (TPR) repeat protein
MSMRRLVTVTACLAWLWAPITARAMPSNPEAVAHLERGNAAYERRDYKVAAEEYKKGYEVEADPDFLYTWAQAERMRDRCAAAVKLYQRYIATNPGEMAAEYARSGIVKCAEALAGDTPLPPDAEPTEGGDDPVEPDDDNAEPDTPPPPEPARKPKWPRDPAAIALVAIGSAATAAGAGVIGAAVVENGKSTQTYGEFDEQQKRVRTLSIAGGVTIGVGVGLLVGGIARWMVLRSRENRDSDAKLSFAATPRSFGVSLTRRF